MAPYVEERVSTGEPPGWPAEIRYKVWFTGHKTGSSSFGACLAHFLVESNPKRYKEVADKKGEVCSDLRKP
jgi:hypothetical protein